MDLRTGKWKVAGMPFFPPCQHAVSGLTDCLTLLQHFETATYYTALSVTVCLSVSCCGVGADEA